MPTHLVTATACLSYLPDFQFLPSPVDLHFAMDADRVCEARDKVASYLWDEGIVPHKLIKTRP